MAIIKYNRLFPQMWSSFLDDNSWPTLSNWNLPTDLSQQGITIYETDDALVAEAIVAGVPEKNVDVTVEGNVLTISASYEETEEEKQRKKTVYKSTRQMSFNYSTSLPRMVDGSKAQAEIENGVVRVTIPKMEQEKPKKITVTKK